MVFGTFLNLPEGANFYIGPNEYQISYKGGTGNDIVLQALNIVPEPLALAGSGWLEGLTGSIVRRSFCPLPRRTTI